MLVFFGVNTLKDALAMDPSGATPEEHGELAEATEVVCKSTSVQKRSPGVAALIETFTLIFIAEWGDRSMLATIALGAAQNPVGVAFEPRSGISSPRSSPSSVGLSSPNASANARWASSAEVCSSPSLSYRARRLLNRRIRASASRRF